MSDDTDLRVRHLDTLQATIGRLSQHSFTIRGWTVTVVSAVFALLTTQSGASSHVTLLALLPTAIFWGLDAYYLHQERLYRRLYAAAANRLTDPASPDVIPFDMNTTPFRATTPSWVRTLVTPTVAAIPVVLTFAILATWMVAVAADR
ncbi:hypothetical protein E0H26_02245 [Micromonospora zingiberis]|uniref:Uncharacterized protein n=1 Tax=Micromonospora zingiberis TaxID=2053011 RepID=A0A4V2LXI3_9ACTN|nr:hypothetical protein [Micromonospora zingiberis]TCC00526.1 hypothetical protein E0H26_02245 [Micromonospora zingiberis]